MTEKTSESLLEACHARAQEASALYQSAYYHSAIYLLSYAVECAMKALIRKNSGGYPRIHDFRILREKCRIPASSLGSQWQVDFLSREQRWVDMRYDVDLFTDWDQDRREKYYQAGGKLIAFFKRQMV